MTRTSLRALGLIAVYVGLSLVLGSVGVPAWITCVTVFAILFMAYGSHGHVATLLMIFGMYGLVLSIPRPEPWVDAVWLVLGDERPFAIRVLLFLIVPMIFFTTIVDPYQLARDISRLRLPAVGAVLQLVGSIRLALFNRLAEIDAHLAVRGIASRGGIRKLKTARLWAVPLVASLITEAANRSSYCAMVGIPFPPRLPERGAEVRPMDLTLFTVALLLMLTWLFIS